MGPIQKIFHRVIAVIFAVLVSADAGAEPVASVGQPAHSLNVAVVDIQKGGAYALQVDTSWRNLSNPTIRIVLVTGNAADISKAEPVFFPESFDIKIIESLAAGTGSFGEAVGLPTTIEVPTKNGGNFELISLTNSLGKRASIVIGLLQKFGGAAACAFVALPQWSKGDTDTLLLDLPASHFAKPGTLAVWLLDGETILDSQILAWPGAQHT